MSAVIRVLRLASALSILVGIELLTSNDWAALAIGLGVLFFGFYVEEVHKS